MLALADQAGVSFSISAAGTLKAKGGREQVACLAPMIKEHKDALLAHLKAMEHGTETSLGTISAPSMAAAAEHYAPETAFVSLSPKEQSFSPLQGIPLSDQEREDIAAGLTPAMARRASEARVYTLEWLLGLERMTQEQAECVARFRRMDAALISARGKKPYLDTLGIPRFPPDCEPKYRHWEEGGQPLLDTLLELKAQDWAIDSRVTQEGRLAAVAGDQGEAAGRKEQIFRMKGPACSCKLQAGVSIFQANSSGALHFQGTERHHAEPCRCCGNQFSDTAQGMRR